MLHRLLLLPLLSPLLAVLVVATLNPKPVVRIRLLTWTSPSLPLGGWIASAAALGAGLSAAATGLALQQQEPEIQPRRQVRQRPENARQRDREPMDDGGRWQSEPPTGWAGPSRGAADPAPTVSVPFRVIRKGRPSPSAQASPAATSSNASDDWNATVSDDW
jgi:hypothetical protein